MKIKVINRGITVLNSPGTIDADYRGEVYIYSSKPFGRGVCNKGRVKDIPDCKFQE